MKIGPDIIRLRGLQIHKYKEEINASKTAGGAGMPRGLNNEMQSPFIMTH